MMKILIILIPITLLFQGCVNTAMLAGVLLDGPSEEKPEVEYGEFPFRLVYETNEGIIEINDAVNFQYAGRTINAGLGIHNKWERTLRSGNDDIILKELGDGKYIEFRVGSVYYYMNSPSTDVPSDYIHNLDAWLMHPSGGTRLTSDKLYEDFGIRIISWEPSPPLQVSSNNKG